MIIVPDLLTNSCKPGAPEFTFRILMFSVVATGNSSVRRITTGSRLCQYIYFLSSSTWVDKQSLFFSMVY